MEFPKVSSKLFLLTSCAPFAKLASSLSHLTSPVLPSSLFKNAITLGKWNWLQTTQNLFLDFSARTKTTKLASLETFLPVLLSMLESVTQQSSISIFAHMLVSRYKYSSKIRPLKMIREPHDHRTIMFYGTITISPLMSSKCWPIRYVSSWNHGGLTLILVVPHICSLHTISVHPRASLLRSLGCLPRALPLGRPGSGLRRGLDDVKCQLAQRRGLPLSSDGLRCTRPQQHERHHVLRLKRSSQTLVAFFTFFSRLFLVYLFYSCTGLLFVLISRARALSGCEIILLFPSIIIFVMRLKLCLKTAVANFLPKNVSVQQFNTEQFSYIEPR